MKSMSQLLEDFVLYNVEKIVDFSENVKVKISISTKAIIIQLEVNTSDFGKVIGKKGRTIDALKVLCLAVKNTKFPSDSRRVLLEVIEDENSSFSYK